MTATGRLMTEGLAGQLCGPGTAICASRGQAHWHKNPFDEPCEFVGMYCGCSSLEKSGYVDMRTEEQKKEDERKLKKG